MEWSSLRSTRSEPDGPAIGISKCETLFGSFRRQAIFFVYSRPLLSIRNVRLDSTHDVYYVRSDESSFTELLSGRVFNYDRFRCQNTPLTCGSL